MSNSVDALWKSVVKLLQQLPAQGPEQQREAFTTIDRQIDVLLNKPSLPRATWKHLIRELKVPLQLGTVCRSLDFNSSDTSSSGSSSRANAVCIALWSWKALLTFLSAAATALIPVTDNPVAAQRASSASLPSAITAQLQQSGLLQHFPSILLTAAQLLKDATTTAGASGYCAPAVSTHGQAAAAASPSSSRGSIVRDSIAVDSITYDNLLLLSAELASAVLLLAGFQPQNEPIPETARRWDAAACFCLAFMQLVSAALDSVPAGSTAPVMLGDIYRSLLCEAVGTLLQVVQAVQFSSDEQLVQLLESSNIRAAVRAVAYIWYAHTLMPSTSGRVSNNRSVAAAAAAAAATAQRQGHFDWHAAAMLCTPRDPPQQQPQQQHFEPYLEAVGVSIHAAAWAAAWMDSTQVQQAAGMVVDTMVYVVRWWARQLDAVTQQQWKHRESTGSAALLVAQQAEQTLLLLQLLLCSLEQQPGLFASDFEGCAAVLAQSTIATTFKFSECYVAAAVTQQEQPSSSSTAGSAAPAAAATAGLATTTQQVLDQATELLSAWSACTLPTLVALLQQAQQRVHARHTAQAAAASSSSRDSSSSSQLSQAQYPTTYAILPLVNTLAAAAHWARLSAMQAKRVAEARPCEGTPSVKLPSASWVRHCLPLSAALDDCFRLQFGSSGALVNSTDACKLVESVACSLLGELEAPVAAAAVLAGPGSAEQRQLFSMLVSLLKVCGALSAVVGADASAQAGNVLSLLQTAGDGCICAALTAAGCLSHRCDALPDTHSSTGGMAASAAAGSPAATAAAAAGSAGQTEAAAAAPATTAATPVDSLPALVLCGCCCLQWAIQLQVLQQQSPDLGERLLLLKQVDADSSEGAAELLQVFDNPAAMALFAGPQAAWGPADSAAGVLRTCRDWLSLGDTAAALAAAGYPAEALLQKLGVLLELLGQPAAAPDAAAAVAAYGQVVQQLQAVGLAFNTLAFPDACNNPFCSNMSGATELESVSGRANMCAGCRVARYCSKACQASHWKQHKAVCKALRAAAVSETTTAD